ncbi:MAG: nitrilase-related carbon-nitrogen hydrolase [Candidatus Thorarchaeota archaeon]
MVKLGIAQMHPEVGELKPNLRHLSEILDEAINQEAEILVLPELANSGYAFESKEEALRCSEKIPNGPFSKLLINWSKENRMVVAGICENSDDVLYNSAGIFVNGNHVGTYRKIHLFNKEKNWFYAGTEEPPVIIHNGNKYGIMICWDWVFPEVARILALKSAQVILHPANLVLTYCQDAMRTRSIENGVFTATANRVGLERNLKFSGRSQVVSNRSEVLLSMSETEVGVRTIEIEPTMADDKYLTEKNHLLNDRVPSVYKLITERS